MSGKVILFEDWKEMQAKYGDAFQVIRNQLEKSDFLTDLAIYRFFRAYEFKVEETVTALKATLEWRKKNKIDEIEAKARDAPQSEWPHSKDFMQIYPAILDHGEDVLGQPLGVVRIGSTRPDLINKLISIHEAMECQQWNMVNRWHLINKLTEQTGRVYRMCRIIDLSGLNAWHLKYIQYFRMMVSEAQSHFPEMMGRIVLVNLPWIFNSVNNMVRPWLNPYTREKIVVAKDFDELKKLVDPVHLPPFLGGSNTQVNWPKIDPDGGMTRLELAARQDIDVPYEVTEGDSAVSWLFHSSLDVKFGVKFFPQNGGEEEVVAVDTAQAHQESVYSWFEPKGRTGTLVFHWDNTYSWVRGKTIFYRIEKLDPKAELAPPKDE